MKTIENLKSEKKSIIDSQPNREPQSKEGKKEYRKAKQRVSWLNDCILYLETFPEEEFLRKQKEQKQKELDHIDDSFEEWQNNTPRMLYVKNARTVYNNLMGRQKVYNHLNTLEYLLS